MLANKRNAKRQNVLDARRLARKIIKGFTMLGLPARMLPEVGHLERPKHYVAVDDNGAPSIEIRTPKAHVAHLTSIIRQVNELRAVREEDPGRRIHARVMEVLNRLGNPANDARRAHKMRDVQWMQDQAAQIEKEMENSDDLQTPDKATDQETGTESTEDAQLSTGSDGATSGSDLQQRDEVASADA